MSAAVRGSSTTFCDCKGRRVSWDDCDGCDNDMGDENLYAPPPPIYKDGELSGLSQDRLFREMNRAYGTQAYVVDNGGDDDASYRSEQRCRLVETEVKHRGLDDAYWAWTDAGCPGR